MSKAMEEWKSAYNKNVARNQMAIERKKQKSERTFSIGDYVGVRLAGKVRRGKLDPHSLLGKVIDVKDDESSRQYKIALPTCIIQEWVTSEDLNQELRTPSHGEKMAIENRIQEGDEKRVISALGDYVEPHTWKKISCKCRKKCDGRCRCVKNGRQCSFLCHSHSGRCNNMEKGRDAPPANTEAVVKREVENDNSTQTSKDNSANQEDEQGENLISGESSTLTDAQILRQMDSILVDVSRDGDCGVEALAVASGMMKGFLGTFASCQQDQS